MTLPETPQVWPEDTQPTPPPPPRPALPKPERAALPLLLAAGLSVLAYALTTGTHGQYGLNVTLWVAAFAGAVAWALRRKHLPPTREGLTLLGAALALATLLTLRDPSPLFAFLDVLALLLSLMLGAGFVRFGWLGSLGVGGLVGAAFTGGLRFVYGPLALLERFPWQRPRFAASRQSGRWGVGLLLTLPVLLVFGGLLASADAGFSRLLDGLLGGLFHWNLDGLATRLLTLLGWGMFAGGLIYPALLAARPSLLPAGESKPGKLGLIEVGMPLGALSALFVVFLALQLPYLLGGTLPDGLTFATYIRKGYGELMTVAFLTLALLLAAHALTAPEARARAAYRLLNLAVLLPLALVILSAANRWRLYTLAYGLSEIRVLGAAFLVWVVGCLGYLAWLLWRGNVARFAYPALLWGLGVLGLTTALSPGAMIARTNLHRQQAGVTNDLRSTPQQVNFAELLNLGPDAVPAVVANLQAAPANQRQMVINTLHARYDHPRDIRAWNAAHAKAAALVRTLPPATGPGWYGGD